jgi:hypothetical protein
MSLEAVEAAPATLGALRSRFLNPEGQFDPKLLPMLEIEDKKGKTKLYLVVAWRLTWWNHDNPMGSRFRITTEVVNDPQLPHVIAEIIDTDTEKYLKNPGGMIAVIPHADGTARAAINPKHVLYSDRKSITNSRVGDPTENAITGAIGRVLARAGYGTEGALELLEDEDFVDAPLSDPERDTVLDMIDSTASTANLSVDALSAIAREIAGHGANSDTMSVEQLRGVLDRVRNVGRQNGSPTPRGRRNEPPAIAAAAPAPAPQPANDMELQAARTQMIQAQTDADVSDDAVVALIREVKGDDPWEPGQPLDALDYVAVTKKLPVLPYLGKKPSAIHFSIVRLRRRNCSPVAWPSEMPPSRRRSVP